MTHNNNNAALSTDYVKIFVQLVEEKGILASDILADTHIDPLHIEKDSHIDSSQLMQLIGNASKLLSDEDWGLQFGERLHLGTHGLLGHVSTSANNSLESLQTYQQFLQIRNQLVSIDYQLTGESVVILFAIHADTALANLIHAKTTPYNRPIIDGCVSGLITILGTKFPLHSVDIPVHLSYPKPKSIETHLRILGSNITFNSNQNSVEIPLHLLTQQNATANAGVFQLVTQQSEAALAHIQQEENLSNTINRHLLENPEAIVSQDMMAEKLNMTPRTLRRRLHQIGSNYQEIQNSVRKDIAIKYLRDTSWSIQEVSSRLGYSEEVNFSRAFKRWVGITPSLFRKQR